MSWFLKSTKNVCTNLNHTEHFLISASTFTQCISISAFTSLISIPVGIMSSAIGLKICAITAGIKRYKSIIKKKKKKHDKMLLLAKSKLNRISFSFYLFHFISKKSTSIDLKKSVQNAIIISNNCIIT